jgi:hypothetical protein
VITAERRSVMDVGVPTLGALDEDHGFSHLPGNFRIYEKGFRVIVSGELTSWDSPCGVNCSYTVSFPGPAYDCIDIGPLSSVSESDFNISALFGENINNRMGAPLPFINASVFFIGLDDFGNESSPIKLWLVYDQLNRTVRCDLYNATYNTNVSYVNNIQDVHTDVIRHNPINDGNFLFNTNATIDPFDFNLFSIHEAVVSMLYGWVAIVNDILYTYSYVANWEGVTQMSDSNPYFTIPGDLGTAVEDLMVNVTLSLNILRNDPIPEIASVIIEQITPAMVITFPPVYTYSAKVLWQIYGSAFAITTFSVGIGSLMLFRDGRSGDLSFSRVLVSTRNPTLDRICREDELRDVRLRYGQLKEFEHICFGTENEISR